MYAYFRMNVRSGVYGDSPFTLHTGGCGEEGEFIQETKQYSITHYFLLF